MLYLLAHRGSVADRQVRSMWEASVEEASASVAWEAAPVNCGHPDCTGVHSGTRPYAEWCPTRRAAHARASTRYGRTEKGRAAHRRYSRTARGMIRAARYEAKQRKGIA